MSGLGITQIQYLAEKDFHEQLFEHKDSRIMDSFAKMAVETAKNIFGAAKGAEIPKDKLGIVIATCTGPVSSIREFGTVVSNKGYLGINPSKFPNIMLSTCLSRVASELQARGPSTVLYINRNKMYQALQYGAVQILKERCIAVIVLYPNEGRGCFGVLLETEESALHRGLSIRFACHRI